MLKLPVRNPVLVAKQATSTAVLTGNRLLLGVGTSPWREDYEVLGVPWERRGRRLDEELAVIRGLAAGGYFSYHGEIFDLPPVKIAPVPDPAHPDPDRRATGTPRCAGPPGTGTAGCTAAAIPRTCPGCWPGWPSSAARRAPTAARSRCM